MKISIMFTLLILFSQWANAERVLVGIAEEDEFEKLNGKAVIRALFAKTEEGWAVIDSEEKFHASVPSEKIWHLAFDGKNLGALVSVDDLGGYDDQYEWTFKRDKVLRIKNIEEFPLLGNKESRFGGWRRTPSNRPIVVVSAPNYVDAEKWKRYIPAKKDVELLYPLTKERIPRAYHCNGAPDWDAKEIQITEDDIKLYRSYKNKKNEKLISIGLSTDHTDNCDGPLDKTDKPMWFYVADGIKFIGYELDLVDAGDYDADGKVEFVFWHGAYDNDGYTLYESNFEKRFDYYWTYH